MLARFFFFKKGNMHKAENYRPVSLFCPLCKIFETIIRDALVQHLESNKLILDSQHGFHKGRVLVLRTYVSRQSSRVCRLR